MSLSLTATFSVKPGGGGEDELKAATRDRDPALGEDRLWQHSPALPCSAPAAGSCCPGDAPSHRAGETSLVRNGSKSQQKPSKEVKKQVNRSDGSLFEQKEL